MTPALDWPKVDPFGGKGYLIQDEPTKRVWVNWNEAEGKFEQCTETWDGPVLEENQELYSDSEGKRWKDGQRVARIPLAWYWRNIMPAKLNGDDKYIKKILNDSDYRKLRTFKGRL